MLGTVDGSPNNNAPPSGHPVKQTRRKSEGRKTCEVCNDCATGYHFNAMTCEGCKGFFRRTMKQKKQYACAFTKNCKIEKGNRRQCQACRLSKCIAIGMKKECIMTDAEIDRKRRLIFSNRIKRMNRRPAMMSDEDQRIINAVSHAFCSSKNEATRNDLKSGQFLVDTELDAFFDFLPSKPNQSPSVIKKVTDHGKIVEVNLLKVSFEKLMKQCAGELMAFTGTLAGFANFTEHDKKCLISGAIGELLHIKLNQFYNVEEEIFVIKRQEIQISYSNSPHVAKSIHNFHKSMKQIDPNETVISMICAICLFSPDRVNLVERNRVEQFQHYYTCVLQSYITGEKKQNISVFANILNLLVSVREVTSHMNYHNSSKSPP